MKNKHLGQNRGFTLVEIMIALGLVSGLMVAVMQMINTGTKGAKKISQDIEQSSVSQTIINTMRDKASCELALTGISLTTAATTTASSGADIPTGEIRKVVTGGPPHPLMAKVATGSGGSATPTYGAGSNGAIYIQSMKLYNYVAGTPGNALLQITFARSNDATKTMTRDVNVMVNDKDSSGTFNAGDTCYSDESFYVSATCVALGGTMDMADGRCKSLNIWERASTANPAITLNGDLLVNVDGTNPGKITAAGNIQTTGGSIITSSLLRLGSATGTIEVAAGTASGSGANVKLTSGGAATINANTSTFNNQAGAAGTAVTINGTATINGATTITGATNITGATGITGNTTMTGNLTVGGTAPNGFIILNKTAVDIGAPGTNDARVVNKEWVYNLLSSNLAGQLTSAQKDAIVTYVLAQSNLLGWTTLRTAILGNFALSPGNSSCAANQVVTNLSWALSPASSTGTSNLTYTCGAPPNCGTNGVCTNVYATTSFCVGATNCMSNVKYDVWGACNWASALGIGMTYHVTAARYMWFCPINYFAAGAKATYQNASYPDEPWCCPSANR